MLQAIKNIQALKMLFHYHEKQQLNPFVAFKITFSKHSSVNIDYQNLHSTHPT